MCVCICLCICIYQTSPIIYQVEVVELLLLANADPLKQTLIYIYVYILYIYIYVCVYICMYMYISNCPNHIPGGSGGTSSPCQRRPAEQDATCKKDQQVTHTPTENNTPDTDTHTQTTRTTPQTPKRTPPTNT